MAETSVGGGRGLKTEFEREIEDALERLADGQGREAPRHHSSAISSRIQALASSELKSPSDPLEESFEDLLEDTDAPPPPPAAERAVEPELSWAYRQQLTRKEQPPPPFFFAATMGAIAGSLTTLIGVGVVLAMTRTRPLPVPERHLATAQVSAIEPRKPVAPVPIAAPTLEATAAPPSIVEPPQALPHPPPAGAAIGSSRPSSWGPRTSARARFKQALPRNPAARSNNAGRGSQATADADGEHPLSNGEMENDFEKEYGASKGAPARDGKPTVYIPPRPNVPDLLTEGDILQVVLAHKPQIVRCLKGHSPDEAPGEKRTLTMRWNVERDGRTSDVTIASPGIEDSPVGTCLAEQIATWRFPPHGKSQPPIRFPFTY